MFLISGDSSSPTMGCFTLFGMTVFVMPSPFSHSEVKPKNLRHHLVTVYKAPFLKNILRKAFFVSTGFAG